MCRTIRPKSAHSRTVGFTLIEVVVVLAIIALVSGLVLVAVQRTRDAAARASCASRLRQLALGVHMYADTGRALPKGCDYPYASSPQDILIQTGLSWHTSILPFVEQPTLWSRSLAAQRADPTGESREHGVVASAVITVFLCPSEPRQRGTDIFNTDGWGLTSYQGVAGTGIHREDGVFHRNYPVRFADITDGTTSTLMIGERPPGPQGLFGIWYASTGYGQCIFSQLLPAAHVALVPGMATSNCLPLTPAYKPSQPDDYCAVGHYWSMHSGGANFAFADGSVRFIRYSAAELLPALATRAGGEVVSLD